MDNLNEVFKKFTRELRTKEQIANFSDELEIAQSLLYKNINLPLSSKLKGKVSESFLNNLVSAEKEGYFPSHPEEQKDFLNKLKDYVRLAPVCRLTFAFVPKQTFILQVSDWLEKQTGKRIVVDIYSDEKILGGAIIEFAGNYRDYSFNSSLEKLLSKRSLL